MEYPEGFEVFWKEYPKRDRPDVKKLAFRAWRARMKEGVSPEALTDAARTYSGYARHKGIFGTSFVMRAATFLGPNERWTEYRDAPPETPRPAPQRVKREEPERYDGRGDIRGIIDGLKGKMGDAGAPERRGSNGASVTGGPEGASPRVPIHRVGGLTFTDQNVAELLRGLVGARTSPTCSHQR